MGIDRADEDDGYWQITHTKLSADELMTGLVQGICSALYIEGDRIYTYLTDAK